MFKLNWMSHTYHGSEGYGRYSAHMLRALIRTGVDAHPLLGYHTTMPDWMARHARVDWSRLTIACMPPFAVPESFDGRIWLMTMTEGSELPDGWSDCIYRAGVERIMVPCEHNRSVFAPAVNVPVHVIPGGTDPYQFPITETKPDQPPYTFVTLADRGARKGWIEVWEAFFQTFGGPEDTPDVRLIVKSRPGSNHLVDLIRQAGTDPRVELWVEDVEHPACIWERADCVVLPSRSEGWGMPHREAAAMGRPVITTRYSGLDDGHTHEWSLPVERTHRARICLPQDSHVAGEWVKADLGELGAKMRWCFENPHAAAEKGRRAATWLRANQTWEHAADEMLALLDEHVSEPTKVERHTALA